MLLCVDCWWCWFVRVELWERSTRHELQRHLSSAQDMRHVHGVQQWITTDRRRGWHAIGSAHSGWSACYRALCLVCQGSRLLPSQWYFSSRGWQQDAYRSWKVMEFKIEIFQAWKVMESDLGPGKSWKVMENQPQTELWTLWITIFRLWLSD